MSATQQQRLAAEAAAYEEWIERHGAEPGAAEVVADGVAGLLHTGDLTSRQERVIVRALVGLLRRPESAEAVALMGAQLGLWARADGTKVDGEEVSDHG